MKCSYDLHIHSALSPCGDMDMTPNNIVNMSLLKGLEIIAVSDHNSCGNVRAVTEAAAGRLLVVPAMEIETAEEVHMLCLFETVENAEDMQALVKANLPDIKNRPEIFGRQCFMDNEDNITGEAETLLLSAAALSIYEVVSAAKERGGLAIPAHIDRSSYSVISNLGFIPPDLYVPAVEITAKNVGKWSVDYADKFVLTNSDAHYLGDIAEAERFLDISHKSVYEVLCTISNANS